MQSFPIQHICDTNRNTEIKRISHQGAHIRFEEGIHKIWILWMETPPKKRRQGLAKSLVQSLVSLGKPIDPGSFSKDAEGLKKYFALAQN